MKELTLEEYKKKLIEGLKYINKIARENEIHYTLVGGSLIGAVRNGGIIPWDDDIDIGLLPKDYDKLVKAIEEDNDRRFRIMTLDNEKTYYYPFAKLIDSSTVGFEIGCKTINGYGAYIDIFKYNNIPDNKEAVERYYKKCSKLRKRLFSAIITKSDKPLKNVYHMIASRRGSRGITKKIIKESEKYNHTDAKYVMINWTPYGAKRETHKKKIFDEYDWIQFDNIKAMVVKDYDSMLRTTFGDYMTPPPKEQQVTHHNMKMYENEEHIAD